MRNIFFKKIKSIQKINLINNFYVFNLLRRSLNLNLNYNYIFLKKLLNYTYNIYPTSMFYKKMFLKNYDLFKNIVYDDHLWFNGYALRYFNNKYSYKSNLTLFLSSSGMYVLSDHNRDDFNKMTFSSIKQVIMSGSIDIQKSSFHIAYNFNLLLFVVFEFYKIIIFSFVNLNN
jgi:hypothetical protein